MSSGHDGSCVTVVNSYLHKACTIFYHGEDAHKPPPRAEELLTEKGSEGESVFPRVWSLSVPEDGSTP